MMTMVMRSQSASGVAKKVGTKKAPPGKSKSRSSFMSVHGKSMIDLGRNIGSSWPN